MIDTALNISLLLLVAWGIVTLLCFKDEHYLSSQARWELDREAERAQRITERMQRNAVLLNNLATIRREWAEYYNDHCFEERERRVHWQREGF